MNSRKDLPGKANRNHKEIARGGAVAFAMKMTGKASGYVLALLISRLYGVETMGAFALGVTVLGIFLVLGRLGLDMAIVKFVSDFASRDRSDLVRDIYFKMLKLIIPGSIVLGGGLFIFSDLLAERVFRSAQLSLYFKMAGVALLPMVLVHINSEGLRGLKRIKEHAFILDVAISLFASVAIGVIFISTGDKPDPFLTYTLSIPPVLALSFYFWFRGSKILSAGPKKPGDALGMRKILDTSMPMLFSSCIFLLMGWTDTIMLGIFSNEAEVGVYNVALKLAMLTSLPLMAINTITAPKISEFYSKADHDLLKSTITHSTKLIFWTSLPIILVIMIFSKQLLGIFSTEFEAGATALLFLCFGEFVNAISGSVGIVLQMTGKEKVFRNIIMTAAAMNFGLNMILIPKFGFNGAAFSSMISMSFWNISSVLYIRSYLKVSTIYFPILKFHRF